MNSDHKLMCRVADLALHSLNGTLDEESLRHLEELLENNPLAAEYYIEVLWTHIGLNSMEGISSLQETENKEFDEDLWQALLQQEKTAPGIWIEKPTEKSVEPELIKTVKPEHKISRFSIYTLTLSAAAILLFVAMVLFSPVRPIVGVLTDSINSGWVDMKNVPTRGDVLRQGTLTLTSGIIEITFDKGARVILEAPAKIELIDTNKIFLIEGKLAAKVPPEAYGFTVATHNALIRDVGTEFGVIITSKGMETHVFDGAVEFYSGSDSDTSKKGSLLYAGQALEVDLYGEKMIQMREQLFIRRFPVFHQNSIAIRNHSFEMDGTIYSEPRVPTGWEATLPLLAGSEDQPQQGNLPKGGYDGDYVGYLTAPRDKNAQILSEMYQNTNEYFVNGGVYELTVAIGRRLDHSEVYKLTETQWKFSLYDATTDQEVSSKSGVLRKEQAGYLTDYTLHFTAGSELEGHEIQVRLSNRLIVHSQPQFDNVRLIQKLPRE
ncbi:MAG: FecR domain-containing protein [Anaerohalosphaera sp.]|nr:FecR domain-containing protein [Anaerohalosphaera sp.]